MELELTRSFNHNEKIATLKIIIKIALSDGEISEKEKSTIKRFLEHNQLKTNENFLSNANKERLEEILSEFKSKSNLCRAQKIATIFAELHGIDPDFEGKLLKEINESVKEKKCEIKFSISRTIKDFFLEFGYLWGKEEINHKTRQVLAIIFTLCACVLGAVWTSHFLEYKFINIYAVDKYVFPQATHSICGLLIYLALCFRGYLPKPNNLPNIIFTLINISLFSYISMHILGRGSIEKVITFYIFFGLILLLWLGIKEILGFVLIGFFILFGYKLVAIDARIAWRALPFIFSAFIGIGFQSSNFFDDFGNFANALFKKPNMDKELIKESLEIAGRQTVKAAKATVSTGITAAKLSSGAM